MLWSLAIQLLNQNNIEHVGVNVAASLITETETKNGQSSQLLQVQLDNLITSLDAEIEGQEVHFGSSCVLYILSKLDLT